MNVQPVPLSLLLLFPLLVLLFCNSSSLFWCQMNVTSVGAFLDTPPLFFHNSLFVALFYLLSAVIILKILICMFAICLLSSLSTRIEGSLKAPSWLSIHICLKNE